MGKGIYDAQPIVQKRRWAPTKHRTEPPHPPVVDHHVEEEAAAHQAAQDAGYEGRRIRKFLQRRTVDYNESFHRWKLQRNFRTSVRSDLTVRPGVNHVVELLPSAAYRTSAQAVTKDLVHSSTNKIRCPVNIIRWTPEGRRLLTGSSSGEFTLWNSLTFNFETILQAHDHAIRALEYTKSGAWILSADQGGIIKYFQSNMNNLQVITAHREAVRDLSFSPDDTRFVTASDDSTMKLWSFEEAREESTLKGHGWDVKCVDWHPFKGLLASGSKDNLVKFWDPRTGTTLATYHGHKGTIQAVQWHKDGNIVATAARDQVVKLYDIRAMGELHTLKGHPSDVCSLDWHPDHTDMLVSGGSEGSILFWSLNSSDPAVPVHSMLEAHESNVWSLSWHPLGHILASGSNDHTTRFWERARPEDGRLVQAGKDSDAQLAQRQKRWDQAVRGGGEDWDEDSGFIPGLGTASKRHNGFSSTSHSQHSNATPDQFLPPGLGMGTAQPPPPPPPPQGVGQNGTGGRYMSSSAGHGYQQDDFMSGRNFVPPPREGGAFGQNNAPRGNFRRNQGYSGHQW